MQSVMKIKSNQVPAIYPKTAVMYTNQRDKKDIFIEEMTIGAEYVDTATRNFYSLAEISEMTGIDHMYTKYSEHEVELLMPRKVHTVKNPYTGKLVQVEF